MISSNRPTAKKARTQMATEINLNRPTSTEKKVAATDRAKSSD